MFFIYMAGMLGFEPRNDGIKIRCVKPLHHTPITTGPPDRTRTCISRLSIVTRYKLAALPLSYRRI